MNRVHRRERVAGHALRLSLRTNASILSGVMVLDHKLVFTADDVYCPVRATLALLGQKWVPHIIHELTAGKRRFNELATLVGGCNSRTLRDRLKNLEALDIVERRIVETMPPWVEYKLTEKGSELAEAMSGLETWGHKYMENPSP
jgi:DNA-binding HxlR family transcriptional regulator